MSDAAAQAARPHWRRGSPSRRLEGSGDGGEAPRIGVLDSMRGIAALAVLLHHAWHTLGEPLTAPWAGLLAFPFGLGLTPLSVLRSGRAAVMFFFVLSGFVLALPLLRGGPHSWGAYAARRICRIWLPFAAAVLLSAGLWLLVSSDPVPGASRWFHAESWQGSLTPDLVLRHLLMLGTADAVGLNNVMWSLVPEMRISFVFPLLVLLARGPLRLAVAVGLAVQFAADATLRLLGLPSRPFYGADLWESLLVTAHFLGSFLLGALVARHRGALLAWLARLPLAARPLLWGGALLLLLFPVDAAGALGAALLILLALGSPAFQGWMATRPLVWLGRNSYSLYLVHVPVLLAVVHLLGTALPVPALALAAIPLSLAASEAMHRCVERPSIALGRSFDGSGRAPAREPTAPCPTVAAPAVSRPPHPAPFAGGAAAVAAAGAAPDRRTGSNPGPPPRG